VSAGSITSSTSPRRHDIHEPRALPVERVAGLHDRREVMTVRRKQRNQVTDVVEARLLVVVHEVRNAGVLRVHLGTAELMTLICGITPEARTLRRKMTP